MRILFANVKENRFAVYAYSNTLNVDTELTPRFGAQMAQTLEISGKVGLGSRRLPNRQAESLSYMAEPAKPGSTRGWFQLVFT